MNYATMNVGRFLNTIKGHKAFSAILLLLGFLLGSVTTYQFTTFFAIKYKLCDAGGITVPQCRPQCLQHETPRATGLTCQQCLNAGGEKCW